MPRTKQNLHKHELIGLKAEIVESTDESKEGIKGKVKDETKNTVHIENKKIPKKEAVFKFYINESQSRTIKGSELMQKPEDRVK